MAKKLNDFQLYEIDGNEYSLNELREFIRIATEEYPTLLRRN